MEFVDLICLFCRIEFDSLDSLIDHALYEHGIEIRFPRGSHYYYDDYDGGGEDRFLDEGGCQENW